jgi:hypothetical protein
VGSVTLEVSESQVVEWVQQMSPEAKHKVLRALIPRLDAFEALVDYGGERIRALCAEGPGLGQYGRAGSRAAD